MPDPEAPHSRKRNVLGTIKRTPFSLSAALIIVSYLGFMSMSLIPLSTNDFKEYSGKPVTRSALESETKPIYGEPTPLAPTPTASASPISTRTPLPTRTPSPTLVPSETPSPVPSSTATPQLIISSEEEVMDWGDWTCRYCDKMPVKVKMTHYWPPLGGENCWWFYEGYCHSPMKSSVPWETLIEIAAACPTHWLGGVVEIPEIGRRYLCLDTGEKVVCEDDVCVVDVLTDQRYPWDGLIYDAVVYYPRVWTDDSRPQVTPFADEQDE
jgi:hypothetical protein